MSLLYFKNPIGGEKVNILIEKTSTQDIEKNLIEEGRSLVFKSSMYNSNIGHLMEWFNDSRDKKIDMFLRGGIACNPALYIIYNCYIKSIFDYRGYKKFIIAWDQYEETTEDGLKEYFADSRYKTKSITEKDLFDLCYSKITDINPAPTGKENYMYEKSGIHISVFKNGGEFVFDWVSGNTILKTVE